MFTVHTIATAPPASQDALQSVRSTYGRVPNLLGVLAESPSTLKAYAAIASAFSESGLTRSEQQLVLITASVEHGCEYCVAAHSTAAKGGKLIDDVTLAALRSGSPLRDDKLEVLRRFTLQLIRERGWVGDEALAAFLSAGFTPAHVLDVLTGLALKTISNYTNHIAATPLDPGFERQRWHSAAVA